MTASTQEKTIQERTAGWEAEYADSITRGNAKMALHAASVIDFILNESEYLGREGQNG